MLLPEIIAGNVDTALILVYLVVRDRLMQNAILNLADQTRGVDPNKVEKRLKVFSDD